ncbi:hypothetical protein Halru_0094 [Halovivax ruber XH-70]|uniref:Uncharacterized protein n=1 Tax=Halovivax ruber (strain DSM 18193 / JCM 13892 / XH-70) TaxID=797302 RepID=L0I928_HALRX|nr:DUF5812 family protein [Halovivax ruber]AGB14746.1 hypothetical protein Halru_0094 [Halovivax ruber XH-70]
MTDDSTGVGSDVAVENAVTGTFVVTHADENSAVLRDVETAQVHTLTANPDFDEHDVIEATVAPEPPMGVAWEVADLVDHWTVDVIDSDLSPTTHERDLADDLAVGDLETVERAGTGEIHVLSVPPGEVEAAAADVVDDVETVARAARLDAVRVEVRRDGSEGVLSVRYLPD